MVSKVFDTLVNIDLLISERNVAFFLISNMVSDLFDQLQLSW